VDALHREPELARPLDLPRCRSGSKAELRLLVRRLDRAVRHGLDPGRESHEHAPHAGSGRGLRLAGRVEHDERLRLRRRPQLLLRLVVAVEHDAVAGDPGGAGETELAEGRDVGADAQIREQTEQRDVREGLRPVDDQRVRRRLAVGAHLAPDRLLAVDEQRCPVPIRQLARAKTAQRELAAFDPGALWKEIEHVASIGIPMQELLLT
jgi:hypothetical protein